MHDANEQYSFAHGSPTQDEGSRGICGPSFRQDDAHDEGKVDEIGVPEGLMSHRAGGAATLAMGSARPGAESDDAGPSDGGPTSEEDGLRSDEITRLQAILADLQKYGQRSKGLRACRSCSVARPSCGPAAGDAWGPGADAAALTCADVVQVGLLEYSTMYPDCAEKLKRLVVEHADADAAIFADHGKQQLYLSVRAASFFSLQDMGSDALRCCGARAARVEDVARAYREVKSQFPAYGAYGCCHSLDDAVMRDLACQVSEERSLAFRRVDVFDAGGSHAGPPARKPFARTQYYTHRVTGDLAALFYNPAGGDAGGADSDDPSGPEPPPKRLDHCTLHRRAGIKDTLLHRFQHCFGCASTRWVHRAPPQAAAC